MRIYCRPLSVLCASARLLLPAVFLASILGCSDAGDGAPASSDGAADGATDAPADSASGDAASTDAPDGGALTGDDLASFKWTHGNGSESLSYVVKSDCGLTVTVYAEAGPPTTTSGTIESFDCTAFKSLVVSPEVIASIDSKADCRLVSDDNNTIRVELKSGDVHERDATGCSESAPYKSIVQSLAALREKYAK
jgi:hypothetical protein